MKYFFKNVCASEHPLPKFFKREVGASLLLPYITISPHLSNFHALQNPLGTNIQANVPVCANHLYDLKFLEKLYNLPAFPQNLSYVSQKLKILKLFKAMFRNVQQVHFRASLHNNV